jgi:PKHD-type hydroxylase
MLLHVPEVLSQAELAHCRSLLQQSESIDGRVTAGYQSGRVKDNMQIPEHHPAAGEMGNLILAALEKNALFMSAALPLKVFPPLFNRYSGGQSFGSHVDNAIRQVSGTPHRVRTDMSATLFFSEPGEYDGGELEIEEVSGLRSVKLPAGDMVLYPATSLHHVRPVTRRARICSFFWIQSMVRDPGERTILFDLGTAVQQFVAASPEHPAALQLTGIYHNLLRRCAEL